MHFLNAFAVLDPKGTISLAERALMIHAVEFMLIVAIPVYVLLFFFAWWYRAGNTKAKYVPDWEHGKLSRRRPDRLKSVTRRYDTTVRNV